MTYLLLIVVVLLLGLGSQAWIKSTYKKWSKVPIATRETGAQAARRMLDVAGLSSVQINALNTDDLADHFDPTNNTLSLSRGIYAGTSVAATAIACHEAGHAVQHARNYAPARIRMALVPVTNVASNAWVILLFAGFFLQIMGLVYVAIALFAFAILFQVVTLPVEFDASHRALETISSNPALPAMEVSGARTVLTAAAFTYVAAALASLLQLIYLIGVARR
jgi:Zn-dependent membrane protease YugP